MENEDKTIECEDSAPSTEMNHTVSTDQETQTQETVMSLKGIDGNEPTEGSNLLNSSGKRLQETPTESTYLQRLRQTFACPPHGLLARVITNVTILVLVGAVVWSITGSECLPGGNLFGIIILFYCAIFGGKPLWLIKLPPLLPLLGPEEVEGSLCKIIHGSLSCGGMLVCPSCPLPNGFTMARGIYTGVLYLQLSWCLQCSFCRKEANSVEKVVPTLLMATGSFDDILAITGFNTFLGMAFSTGSTVFNVLRGVLKVATGVAGGSLFGFFIQYFPSSNQDNLVWKWAFLVLGLSVLAVFSSVFFGFPGSGGLCTLVMAFLAGMGWTSEKAEVEQIIAVVWDIFQPLLFGLIGTEVSIASLRPETVGCNRICGFGHSKVTWRETEEYRMDMLTVAFLSILITAPVGSLLIGLVGPRLLQKAEHRNNNEEAQGETSEQVEM